MRTVGRRGLETLILLIWPDVSLSNGELFQGLWLPYPSREEPDISLSIVNSKHAFVLTLLYSHFTRVISPKHGSALNTRRNDFIRSSMIERGTSCKCFGSHCEG